jgi:DNA polymerase-3 subunit alpha
VSAIPLPIITESAEDRKELLTWEKELLGVTFSSDPRKQALETMDKSGLTALGDLRDPERAEELVGKVHSFAGLLANTRRISTKKGDSMLVAVLEDETEETVEMVAFPKTFEKYREVLVEDTLVRVTAKVDRRNEGIQLVLESVSKLDPVAAAPASPPPLPAVLDLEGLGEMTPPQPPFDQRPQPYHIDGRPTVESQWPEAESRQPSTEDQRPRTEGGQPMSETHDSRTTHDPKPAAAPPIAEPVSIIRPKAKPAAASNGNGNSQSNGSAAGAHAVSEPSGSQRSLRLRLPHADDFDAYVQLMQQVYELLRQSSGEDQVIIHLPKDNGAVLLKPRSGVQCNDLLVGELSGLLGAEHVAVE